MLFGIFKKVWRWHILSLSVAAARPMFVSDGADGPSSCNLFCGCRGRTILHARGSTSQHRAAVAVRPDSPSRRPTRISALLSHQRSDRIDTGGGASFPDGARSRPEQRDVARNIAGDWGR